jgi:hypothetical protein
MNLRDEKAADAAELLEAIGEPVIWNGRTFKALISPVEVSAAKAGVGGFEEGYDFTVKIAASAFPDNQRPQPDADIVTFDGRDYLVGKVTSHLQSPFVTLHVLSP